MNKDQTDKLGIFSWPVWSCGVSVFPWTYDRKESCFILEGDVIVKTEHQSINITKKDFVIFPKGLSCSWNVSKPVKKHYMFE